MIELYSLLADLILIVHFAFVVFVVVGLVLVWVGWMCRWRVVRNVWFRAAHLLAIGVVMAESLAGVVCPLTTWENELRRLAGGGERYQGSFVQHWLHRVMFYDASESAFTVLYLFFFGAVLLSFWLVPPRWPARRLSGEESKEG
jgi:hypothetical protein